MKLFKFRSLADEESFERTLQIIETGKFWCSKLWYLNDPMEGVYSHRSDELEQHQIDSFFGEKNSCVICCFSGEKAFENPTMWGYYAGGFRGVAIEIQLTERQRPREVRYASTATKWAKPLQDEDQHEWLQTVMTTKLAAWSNEDEQRYLLNKWLPRNKKGCSCKIGTITRVHLGLPFWNARNIQSVLAESESLQEYYRRAMRLYAIASSYGFECGGVQHNEGKVTSVDLRLEELRQHSNGRP